MLVLHSSSRCDVCMDAYTFQTIAQSPHAIPCGHIFCRPCLFALSPLICPLCRKRFDPSKAKRLHVDRPETVDENRDVDLLQRMAISAEAPEDQLQELLNEVDAWLDSRADDTCLVLRQARATLTRYLELKKLGPTLEGALADFNTRFEEMRLTCYTEHQERTKLEADKTALISENEDLKAEVQELRIVSEQYGYLKNPLPPPPQPIPIEYLPSFPQALAHDHQPFKVQGQKYHKGKAKSLDHRLVSPSPSQNPPPLPTQQAKMDPSEENPALVSHLDHPSPLSRQPFPTPAPPSGLKLHFENTNQPLDAHELVHTYLREYSQGVLDGQLMAGKQPSTSQQPRAGTSRMHSDVSSLQDRNEFIDARSIRSNRSNQARETQSFSGSSMLDPPSRPLHQRHNTVPSLLTSPESTSTSSSSRSIPRSNPILADLLSNNAPIAPQPRRPIPSLPASPPDSNPNPILSVSQPSPQGQHIESLLQSIQINTRSNSPASSRRSKASTWGTLKSTSTNHTIYSLLGLRDFRENFAVSPPQQNGSSRIEFHRTSQYSLNSWHGSTASSLSPMSQMQDQLSTNGYQHEGGDENAIRRDENTIRRDENTMRRDENTMRRDESAMRRDDEAVNPSYSRDSRDSTGSRRQRPMEPQRMTRGRNRNQPLPALSPTSESSFSYGEIIVTEEENGSSESSNFLTFGNALGLELSTGPIPISAPTPVVPHRTFLRSFSSSGSSDES